MTNDITTYDLSSLDDADRLFIEQRTIEIRGLMRRSAEDIRDIGQKLIDVKARLDHGQFSEWLAQEFDMSEETARRFIRVATKFKSVNLTDLAFAPSALYLLASAATPEEAVDEALERAEEGEEISHKTAQEIVGKFKPPSDERAAFMPEPGAHWYDNYEAACEYYQDRTVFMGIGQRGRTWIAIGPTAARVGEQIRNMPGVVKVGDVWRPALKIAMWEPERTEHLEKLVGPTVVYLEGAREPEELVEEIEAATLYGAPARPGMPQSQPSQSEQAPAEDDIAQGDNIDLIDPPSADITQDDPATEETTETQLSGLQRTWDQEKGQPYSTTPPLDVANLACESWIPELVLMYKSAAEREHDPDIKKRAEWAAWYWEEHYTAFALTEDDEIFHDVVEGTATAPAALDINFSDTRTPVDVLDLFAQIVAAFDYFIAHLERIAKLGKEDWQRLYANFIFRALNYSMGLVVDHIKKLIKRSADASEISYAITAAQNVAEVEEARGRIKLLNVGNQEVDEELVYLHDTADTHVAYLMGGSSAEESAAK